MQKWIERIDTKPTNVPRESPSLSEVAEENRNLLKIGDIDRILVSTHWESEFSDDTHIIHLKTDIADRRIETRIRKSLESPDLFKDASDDAINIDTVFQNIKETYDKRLLKVVYNTILMIEDKETTDDLKPYYINGLLKILNPTNDNIRKWIREKLTC